MMLHLRHFIRVLLLLRCIYCVAAFADLPLDPVEQVQRRIQSLAGLPLSVEEKIAESGRLTYWYSKYSNDTKVTELLKTELANLDKVDAEHSNNPRLLISWIAVSGETALRQSKLHALAHLQPLEKAALHLKEVDPTFGFYAADRILGRLYHLAPSFFSIGSRTKAREHFELALKGAPEHPENMLFFADFLHSIGESDRARQLLETLLSSPKLADFPMERVYWESESRRWLGEWRGKG